MKVLAINGSARKDGNTAALVRHALGEIQAEGIETELVQLAGRAIHGCTACYQCFEKQDRRCAVTGDAANECPGAPGLAADGPGAPGLASPTYFADVSAEMKALIDRAGLVAKANDPGAPGFRRKVGAAVVAVRRGGAIHAFDSINHFFLISQMIVPGSRYWNMGFGLDKGEADDDAEGVDTMKVLGRNMAWLLKKIAG